jgi:hypothetical protein
LIQAFFFRDSLSTSVIASKLDFLVGQDVRKDMGADWEFRAGRICPGGS